MTKGTRDSNKNDAAAKPSKTEPFGAKPGKTESAPKPGKTEPGPKPAKPAPPVFDPPPVQATKTDPFGVQLPPKPKLGLGLGDEEEVGPGKGWSDSTMMVQMPPDVGIAKLQAELPQDNLAAMQKVLSRCEVTHISPALAGFNFKNFVQNLKGISKVELGEVKLYALLTRHNAFILANLIAEQLHDLVKGLMDLHLGDRITLKDADKVRYLYKVPSAQMERLRTIANQNRLVIATGFAFKDLAQLRQKLAACPSPGGFEDLKKFAGRIAAVSSLYTDKDGNGYHLLMMSDGMAFQLFVSPKTPIPNAANLVSGTVRLSLVSA
ncbi:MAG: hypothetical protein QM765_45015 [Myxococcales bacterium]